MLWNLFCSVVARQPGAAALSMGEHSWTYAEVKESARALAARLRQAGFSSGQVAAVYLPNHPGFVHAVLAILHEGGAVLPLSIKYLEKEVTKYLLDAQPQVILVDAARRAAMEKVCAALPEPRPILLDAGESDPSAPLVEPARVTPSCPVLCQYSTGSTGQSKSVRRTYSQLQAEIAHYQMAVRVRPNDRLLGAVPLFHAHGFGNCLLGALFNGASLELVEGFNPREVQKILSEKKITIFPGVPFIFKILSTLKNQEGAATDFSSLRLCFSAGAPLDAEISAAFERVYGQPVRQLYGTTETGSISINLDEKMGDTLDSVGLPMNDVRISIRDEDGAEQPTGTIGEIWIKSPAMTSRYENDPESTARHFRDGWFSPGDLAVRDGKGRLFIRGRKTLFINVGGNKVDPAEVEKYLLSYPKISDAAVLGHGTVYGGQLVKAFVVPSEEFEKDDLLAFCQSGLAEFKVPKIVEFRSEIPRSPLGKVLRKYLQD